MNEEWKLYRELFGRIRVGAQVLDPSVVRVYNTGALFDAFAGDRVEGVSSSYPRQGYTAGSPGVLLGESLEYFSYRNPRQNEADKLGITVDELEKRERRQNREDYARLIQIYAEMDHEGCIQTFIDYIAHEVEYEVSNFEYEYEMWWPEHLLRLDRRLRGRPEVAEIFEQLLADEMVERPDLDSVHYTPERMGRLYYTACLTLGVEP